MRPPLHHDGSTLDVKAVFPTIQGEGPFSGWPAVFVRLGGCNLACDFCDTAFEDYRLMPLGDVLKQVEDASRSIEGWRVRTLVVITGGEPLRQNIIPLCEALLALDFTVQIETNGTLWRELPQGVQVVCSPKNTGQGYAPLRADVLARAQALKFIVAAQDPHYGQVAEVGQAEYNIPVYVQPMDEHDAAQNAKNLQHAVSLAQAHGYRLSLQLHKLLGIE